MIEDHTVECTGEDCNYCGGSEHFEEEQNSLMSKVINGILSLNPKPGKRKTRFSSLSFLGFLGEKIDFTRGIKQ